MQPQSLSGRKAPVYVTAAISFLAATVSPASAADKVPVAFDNLHGFTKSNRSKLDQASAILSEVLSSDAFKQAVEGFTYQGKPQFVNNERADADGNTVAHDLSNSQIYDALIESRETYLNNTDREVHLDLTLYSPPWYKRWSVVGYGYPGQPQIYMNVNYFNSYTPAQIAANLAHEWTHKLGFDHDYNRTARRPYSVPYAVGCIVEQLGSGKSVAACEQ